MKKLIAILVLVAAFAVNAALPFGIPELPAVAKGNDGLDEDVRASVIGTFAENVYGVRPDLSGFVKRYRVLERSEVAELSAERIVVELNVMTPIGERVFKTYAYFPKKTEKVPVFVYLSFNDPAEFDNSNEEDAVLRWDVKDILAKGYATASFSYNDVLPDQKDVFAGVERAANGWGAISCWALAASRVADWLETEPRADLTKLAVVGHSRLGKTALWTGAGDKRFSLVVSNCSGCFGSRVQNVNWRGETVEQIVTAFPHWFAPKCRELIGKDRELPFGQHWLIATIAPRLMIVAAAEDDWWACPSGELLGWELSRCAWGRRGDRSHFFIRRGDHNIRPSNWIDYLDFVKTHGW